MVVEDAAQALLSTYKGRFLGSIGHLGCLSFHETKNIISGEGGSLLVNAPELQERAEIIWEKGTNRKQFHRGQVDKYTWVDVGSSFLPSDIIAAFLHAQLELCETIIGKRRRIFNLYQELLEPLQTQRAIRLPNFDSRTGVCNGHIFHIICNSLEERTGLIHFLRENGIQAVFHYVPLHSSPAGLRLGRAHGDMSITDTFADRVLRLPVFYEMTDDEVERVRS